MKIRIDLISTEICRDLFTKGTNKLPTKRNIWNNLFENIVKSLVNFVVDYFSNFYDHPD